MEKVKVFVIKHQLWFKLAAIALLVATIFTPFVHIHAGFKNGGTETVNFSIFDYVFRPSYAKLYNNPSIFLFIAAWLAFIGSLGIIALLLFCLRNKDGKLILLCSYTYCLIFILILFATIYSLIFYTPFLKNMTASMNAWGIPHIAFFIALFLFVADILCIVYMKKEYLRAPTKSERIAELEKRIEELENRKDGE